MKPARHELTLTRPICLQQTFVGVFLALRHGALHGRAGIFRNEAVAGE